MRILTWNIACLPREINILRNPNKIIDNIIDKIFSLEPNVICLQELFDYKIQKRIAIILKASNFDFHISKKDGLISKNGLLTATNYNILKKEEVNFLNFTGPEYLIKKGLLTTTIQNPNNNESLFIHNTHLQSNSMGYYKSVCQYNRQRQHAEINYLLNNYNKEDLHILCGDINDDYNTKMIQDFIESLPFNEIQINDKKLPTFPKRKEQLDYIILNKKFKNISYNVVDVKANLLSDHSILLCDYD